MDSTKVRGYYDMAERVGFEPTVEFPQHTLSKRAPSTTRTPLRAMESSFRLTETCSRTKARRGDSFHEAGSQPRLNVRGQFRIQRFHEVRNHLNYVFIADRSVDHRVIYGAVRPL